MNWMFVLIPLISAFIGWFTNWIAIKMLFHPREPKKIFGITFQGIFPKRQKQFAMKLGKLVSKELLSFSDLEQKISDPANVEKLMPVLEVHIETFLKEKLPVQIPMLGMLIGEKTISQVKGVFIKELEELFPVLMKQYMITLESELDLEKIVIEKVGNFSSDKLEDILNQIMSTEFRFVEIIGAVLGFIIGLVQVLITIATM
ncbi:MAG: YheB [Segetibacter sp.]|nr:YheB [Segetibacter sp.]